MVKRSFKIINESGIHARPATTLVNTAIEFKSNITLTALKREVDFKSIMGVMSLGIYSGTVIEIKCDGEDEVDALNAISKEISTLQLGREI